MTSPARVVRAQESCIPSFEAESKLEARFECPICLQCLKDPLLTTCGHRFCSECINMWLRNKGTTCPVDGQTLDRETDLFPDNFTRREIFNLEEPAAQENCPKRPALGIDAPRASKDVNCIFEEFGCPNTCPREHLAFHLESSLHSHLNLMKTAFSELKSTVQEQQMVAKSREAQFWEPEAKGHPSDGSARESSVPWESLLRTLYERVVVLEQRNHEQEIQLENLKRQMATLSSSSSSSAGLERLSQTLLLQYCGGVLVWKITGFAKKLQNMLAAPNHRMEYSPSFYTSPSGYRVCARLNVSPKERDYLSLLIHLKKGINDPYLSWPFSGRISITLINQASPLHLEETMMSRPELDAFKQPTTDMNYRGFGYTQFIAINELEPEGFLREDCIVIKIQVQCV